MEGRVGQKAGRFGCSDATRLGTMVRAGGDRKGANRPWEAGVGEEQRFTTSGSIHDVTMVIDRKIRVNRRARSTIIKVVTVRAF